MAAPLGILIIDSSLEPVWETELRETFGANGMQVFKLSPTGSGLSQVEKILKDHPGTTSVTIVGHDLLPTPFIRLGDTTYFSRLDMHTKLMPLVNEFPDTSIYARGLGDLWWMTKSGTAGNDVLMGNRYDELIDGLSGIDTLKLTGKATDHNISAAGTNFQTSSWDDGMDFMANIERLKFSDYNVAIDISGNGNTGTALRFLTAVAGADAIHDKDMVGVAIAYADSFSPAALASKLVDSGVVAQFAGGNSNEQLISMLYTHIVGAAPSTADVTYYVNYMANNHLSQAQMLQWAAELPQTANRIDLVGLAEHGVAYLDHVI